MFSKLFIVCVIVKCVIGAPQFLTYKNGNFGVNFGGYHAEAGLGGLLTGDKAHGGLHASAGTPHGQNAGAGIGGLLDGNGRMFGGGFAGASAGHGVGASSGFGGAINSETQHGVEKTGGLFAESHTPRRKFVKLTNIPTEKDITIIQPIHTQKDSVKSLKKKARLEKRINRKNERKRNDGYTKVIVLSSVH